MNATAGERTKILHIVSDSIPQTVRFAATDAATGGPVTGRVEVERTQWFVSARAQQTQLQPQNAFHKGFADTRYAIYVTPDRDARIAFATRHFERSALLIVLACVAALGLLSALVFPLLRP